MVAYYFLFSLSLMAQYNRFFLSVPLRFQCNELPDSYVKSGFGPDFFLLVDLRDFFSDLGPGDEKNK